jgi:hypothetical protein
MKLQVLILAVALGGCAIMSAPVQSYTTPDGRQGYMLRCGGVLMTMATCYTDARKMCQGGDYEVINRSVTPRDDTATENRNIEIVCKR